MKRQNVTRIIKNIILTIIINNYDGQLNFHIISV